MDSLRVYLMIAAGGALGASLRYFIAEQVLALLGRGFPYATLLVNVLGSFLIGLLYGCIEQEIITIVPWRTFLGIGFLGAFTTFSTFSLDSILLIQQGQWLKAGSNIVLNVVVCLLVVWLAMQLTRQWQ